MPRKAVVAVLAQMRYELTRLQHELHALRQDRNAATTKFALPDVYGDALASSRGLRRASLWLARLTRLRELLDARRVAKILDRLNRCIDDKQVQIVLLRRQIVAHCIAHQLPLPPLLARVPPNVYDRAYLSRLCDATKATTQALASRLTVAPTLSASWHFTTFLDERTSAVSYLVQTPPLAMTATDAADAVWDLHATRTDFDAMYGYHLTDFTIVNRGASFLIARVCLLGTDMVVYVCCFRAKVRDLYEVHIHILDYELHSLGLMCTATMQPKADGSIMTLTGSFLLLDREHWMTLDTPGRADYMMKKHTFGLVRWLRHMVRERSGEWCYNEKTSDQKELRTTFPCVFKLASDHHAGYRVLDALHHRV
ncbi:hypothetical protein SPRG_00379 [Saprolegnia parasitica CBS 223.65]|uniref:Uncharacterized protein n=1 Tax=Saprolegnia parasitica (strain CBS 223.65) TaxID=695850 RepID=A0A067CYE2_SAPPC|nr:hypothetical protein SPRG_00379 [Saprolegnia parasitica CBS 223.65]KDO35533.1 hypothetical protein SPRG_00379 [Saprolegnia parasitica CBS 223.65]|eukprot:XP_012193868.1 hypothetical protein SPRG_00379 [Saprolegnia parasitica CBS 223.65]